jgi:hypothetical protein
VRCAQKMTRRGMAGEGSRSEGSQSMARSGQTCSKDRTGAVAVRAVLDSGEATKRTCKQKWPTLRNVGIRYSWILLFGRVNRHERIQSKSACLDSRPPRARNSSIFLWHFGCRVNMLRVSVVYGCVHISVY